MCGQRVWSIRVKRWHVCSLLKIDPAWKLFSYSQLWIAKNPPPSTSGDLITFGSGAAVKITKRHTPQNGGRISFYSGTINDEPVLFRMFDELVTPLIGSEVPTEAKPIAKTTR